MADLDDEGNYLIKLPGMDDAPDSDDSGSTSTTSTSTTSSTSSTSTWEPDTDDSGDYLVDLGDEMTTDDPADATDTSDDSGDSWTPPEGWDSSTATAESYGDLDDPDHDGATSETTTTTTTTDDNNDTMGDWTPPEGWDSSEATAESYGDFDAGGMQGVDSELTYTIDQYGEVFTTEDDEGNSQIVAPEGFELDSDQTEALTNLIDSGWGPDDLTGSMPDAPEMPEMPEIQWPDFSQMQPAGGGGIGTKAAALIAGGVLFLAAAITVDN